jgi:phage-related protein
MKSKATGHVVGKVEFQILQNGRCPVAEYVGSFPAGQRAILVSRLELLEGHQIGVDSIHIKHIRGKLLEYKISVQGIQVRFFFYINAERTAVLVHAVTKKRGKLPPSEFDVAEGRIP